MNSQVIIIVADNNYINQAKSLMANCRLQGQYKGDFAIICPVNTEAAAEFKSYGIDVLETNQKGFLQKFEVFNEYFKKWDKALYMDCDILVQDNLQRLFDLLNTHDMWMDTEDGKIIDMFWRDEEKHKNQHIYDWLKENYPHTYTNQTFNSAFILFNTCSIDSSITQKLIELQQVIHSINDPAKLGTDQQPINILIWHLAKKIPNKLVCFWGLAEPQNDVDSEWRQFKKGDIPVAIHYTRWYCQWINKTPDMDAYLLRHLNIPCYELYQDNLSKFDTLWTKA